MTAVVNDIVQGVWLRSKKGFLDKKSKSDFEYLYACLAEVIIFE